MAVMQYVPLALAFVAVIAVVTTALHFMSRHKKKKGLKSSSPSSDSNITKPTSNLGHEVHQVLQVNESLFELYKPPANPSLQILFFHGFQFGDYENAHISTWESKDKNGSSIMWPQIWLREEFPDAHIFSIAYNCRIKESRQYGQADLFILGENLMADLLEANIGQDRRCPVVLVGHSFGGLVMKKLCLFAGSKGSTGSKQHAKFLQNVKGLFFYSTPHGGIKRDTIAPLFKSKSPLLENVEVLSTSTARLNDDFEKLRLFYKDWRVAGIGEGCATRWGSHLPFMVVEEASSRYGDEFLVEPGANHMTISRPHEKNTRTFTALTKLVHDVNQTRKVSGVIHQTHGLPNFSSGLEKRVEEAQNLLEYDTSQGTVLGIVGMGGVGKTTVAKQLFNKISSKYEYTCFVENVKEIPLHALEEKVLKQFCHDGASMTEGRIQWSYFEKKKTLIVMDDVSSIDQLRKVPKLDHFGTESHLIITGRDQSLLDDFHNCTLYDVSFLTPDEGKELLCQHVFGAKTIEGDHHLAKWVDKVVQKCGGLPLTLEVIGSYLRAHSKVQFWAQTISKLEKAESVNGSRNDRVWASLKVSIDDLNENERETFLDAATCYFDKPLHEAFGAWSTANGGVDTVWVNLISRSLVKSVQAKPGHTLTTTVWVHEHLRHLAMQISQRHSISTQSGQSCDAIDVHTRSCLHTFLIEASRSTRPFSRRLPDVRTNFWCDSRSTTREGRRGPDLDTKRVHQRLLDANVGWVQLELFDHMENLKYLDLNNILPKGMCNNFPQSISFLRWTLDIEHKYPELPPICCRGLHNLGYLHLAGWQITMEFVEALGSCFNLRSLSLVALISADGAGFRLGGIGNLSSLNQLTLERVKVIALPDSLGDLYELEKLKLASLTTLQLLPKSIGSLCSLKELSIHNCGELKSLPESLGHLSCLQKLTLESCRNLESLPAGFGLLAGLQRFVIISCNNLKSLSDDFGNLSSLSYLSLLHSGSLEELPASFGMLPSLEEFILMGCETIQRLPDEFGQLEALKTLRISSTPRLQSLSHRFGNLISLTSLSLGDCRSLEELPANFGMLPCLEQFSLTGCETLQRLPNEFGQLKALKTLTIRSAPCLQSLSHKFGNLISLTSLRLEDCRSLEELPASFGILPCLEEFVLIGCETLQRLPDEFGQLKALKNLSVFRAPRLQSLSNRFGNLVSLTSLRLEDCRSLEELPASFGMLPCLEQFDLVGCETLQRLPDEFGKLKALKKLAIVRAPRLQSLSHRFGNLILLTSLRLEDCRSLEELPASFGMLPCLEKFHLIGCETLQRLPDEFGQLKVLKKLAIFRAPHLQSLSHRFGNLISLTSLKLGDCRSLEELPASFGMLPCLEELELVGCETLQRLPDEFGQLKALKTLAIRRAPRLQSLSHRFGNLISLTSLRLEDCRSLEELPESFGMLPCLEEIHLIGCETLQRFPDGLMALKHLKIVRAPHFQAHSSLWNFSAILYLELDDWRFLEKLPSNFGFLSESKSEGSHASSPRDIKGVVHQYVMCDNCRMVPIEGARYACITEPRSNLCSNCFLKAGSPAGYIRISNPPKPDRTQVFINGFSDLNHLALTNLGWVLVGRNREGDIYQRI